MSIETISIGVVTASYNRAQLLPNLFASLQRQDDSEFIWIIIDDGSTDNTADIVERFISQANFEIHYLFKANGGKHSALNIAFKSFADIDFFLIIDSDDVAEHDAIRVAKSEAGKWLLNEKVGCIEFFQKNSCGEIIGSGKKIRCEEVLMNAYEYESKYDAVDGTWGIFQRAIIQYQFPIFENENFMGESVLALQIAKAFLTYYSMRSIVVVEYRDEGLSKLGRKYRMKNPLGMIVYCGLKMDRRNPSLFSRVKYTIAAQAYATNCGIKKSQLSSLGINPKTLKTWAKPFGSILGYYWSRL